MQKLEQKISQVVRFCYMCIYMTAIAQLEAGKYGITLRVHTCTCHFDENIASKKISNNICDSFAKSRYCPRKITKYVVCHDQQLIKRFHDKRFDAFTCSAH